MRDFFGFSNEYDYSSVTIIRYVSHGNVYYIDMCAIYALHTCVSRTHYFADSPVRFSLHWWASARLLFVARVVFSSSSYSHVHNSCSCACIRWCGCVCVCMWCLAFPLLYMHLSHRSRSIHIILLVAVRWYVGVAVKCSCIQYRMQWEIFKDTYAIH